MKQLKLHLHPKSLTGGVLAKTAFILGLFLFGLDGLGAEQTPPKDFSAGFAKFYNLGLPVVTNAAYVKLDVYHRYGHTDFDYALYEIRLAGNAWMLQHDQAEGKGLFVMDYCRVVEVYDQSAFQKKQAAKLKQELATKKAGAASAAHLAYWSMNEPQDQLVGHWKAADPKKDIEKIIAFLKKKTAESSARHDPLSHSSGYGTLLLAAIHFHRMGFTNEANEIAGLLFDAAQDQRKVLTQGLVKLADAQYSEVADRFFKTGDWQAYSKDLESLLGKFATAWEKAPAVQRLAERVKARLNQPQPPAVTGEDLSAEDKLLALEMATTTNWNWNPMFGSMGRQLWVVPAPEQHRMLQAQSNTVTRILDRGMKSVPLLLALVKDDYLTSLDIRTLKGTSSHTFFGDDAGMTEERINLLYDALRRPASRSDIAVHCLNALLIKDEEHRSSQTSLNRDELYEQGKTWYSAHKNQSAADLARFFLKEGNAQQQNPAITYLLKSGNESDMATIEGLLLKAEDPMHHLHLAQQYVMERKEKASNFVAQYEAVLTNLAESGESGYRSSHGDFKQMIEQSLAAMKASVAARPPEAVLEEILTGTKSWEEAGAGLYQVFAQKKPDELLPLLLGAALKATNADLRIQFVQMAMSSVAYRQFAPPEAGAGTNGAGDNQFPEISKTADLWKQLLADTRAPDNKLYPWERSDTVADSAASALETIYGQQGPALLESRELFHSLGARINPLIKARAEARLAGKPENELPAMPSAAAVSKEQKKKMADELIKAGAAELEAKLAALNLDSLLALAEEADANPALNKKLGTLANRVNAVSVKLDQGTTSNEWEALKGKTLDKAMVEQLMTACRKATEDGMISQFWATRRSCMGGMEIQVKVMSATNQDALAQLFGHGMPYAEMKKAMLGGMFSSEDQHAYANWPVEQKKQPAAEKKGAPSATNTTDDLPDEDIAEQVNEAMQEHNAEQQAEFWKAVEEFCAGNGKACAAASIQFNGMPILPDDVQSKPGRRGHRRIVRGSR